MRKYIIIIITALSVSCSAPYSQSSKLAKDQKEIKALIKLETNALVRDFDLDAYMSCFAKSDKTQSGPVNDKMTVGYIAIQETAKKVIASFDGKPNPNTWSYANWDIRVGENMAYATVLQTTKTEAGTYIDVYKSDYLERINGEWKIVDHRFFHTEERQTK